MNRRQFLKTISLTAAVVVSKSVPSTVQSGRGKNLPYEVFDDFTYWGKTVSKDNSVMSKYMMDQMLKRKEAKASAKLARSMGMHAEAHEFDLAQAKAFNNINGTYGVYTSNDSAIKFKMTKG